MFGEGGAFLVTVSPDGCDEVVEAVRYAGIPKAFRQGLDDELPLYRPHDVVEVAALGCGHCLHGRPEM